MSRQNSPPGHTKTPHVASRRRITSTRTDPRRQPITQQLSAPVHNTSDQDSPPTRSKSPQYSPPTRSKSHQRRLSTRRRLIAIRPAPHPVVISTTIRSATELAVAAPQTTTGYSVPLLDVSTSQYTAELAVASHHAAVPHSATRRHFTPHQFAPHHTSSPDRGDPQHRVSRRRFTS